MKIHEYNEMMAYLTRPAVNRTGFSQGTKKVAGLTEEYYGKDELKYQEAVKNGFQGTFEEYLQWMRKNAAQGGVIGKGGMFQGEDLGYRTGFKKIYLPNTQRGQTCPPLRSLHFCSYRQNFLRSHIHLLSVSFYRLLYASAGIPSESSIDLKGFDSAPITHLVHTRRAGGI